MFTLPGPVNERSRRVRYLLIKDTLLSFKVVPVVVRVVLQYRFLSLLEIWVLYLSLVRCVSQPVSHVLYRFGVIATAIVKLSPPERKFSTENTRSKLTLEIHVYISNESTMLIFFSGFLLREGRFNILYEVSNLTAELLAAN